jgi:hypothetical protein
LITKKMSFEENVRNRVRANAVELATKYLNKLSENEERCTLDVALSAVYLSCRKSGVEISQTQLASAVSNGLNRWPCVVIDMNKRL